MPQARARRACSYAAIMILVHSAEEQTLLEAHKKLQRSQAGPREISMSVLELNWWHIFQSYKLVVPHDVPVP